MVVRASWVGYGRAAASALRAQVAAAKAGEPLAPVTVVVPSNHVGVATRRLLAGGALGSVTERGVGLAAVTFVTPYRLAELLGAPRLAGSGRRPVSTPVLAAAFRAALREGPGVFGPVAEHPATESALIASYQELRDLSPRSLARLAAASARAGDVVRLCRSVRHRLEAAWYDEEDLMVAAAAAVDDPAALRPVGSVVVYLPQRLSLHAAALLRALGERTEVAVVAGTTGDARADHEVVRSLARLGLPGPPAPDPDEPVPGPAVSAQVTRVVTTSDPEQEVRVAVRAVVDAARAGVPLDRIAVLHASPAPYGRLLHEHAAAAGLAANGAAVTPLAGRAAGRFLLEALALPRRGFRRHDVMAWLASAPVRDGRGAAPVAEWDRISRDAGVVAGRDQWDRFLSAVVVERRARAQAAQVEAGDGEPSWAAERHRREAERAARLRDVVCSLADELAEAAEHPRRWAQHAAWAQRLLDRLLGDDVQRAAWPADERKAAERVQRALARLAALDAVEGPVTLDVFERTVGLELEADLGRVGRFGEGVLVGSVGMGVGLDLDLVVVLGLAEGSFPGGVHDDSLLPDHERAHLGDELALRADRVERQHRELLAALAAAGRHHLSVPRGDLRQSRETVPSRWVLQVAERLGGRPFDGPRLLAAKDPWIEHEASLSAGLRTVDFPATGQEHRLRRLLAAGGDGRRALAMAADGRTRRAAEAVAARRSTHFTRFDGNLAGLPIPSPVHVITAPTRLERWASCPFAYFVQDVLGVRAVEDPERALRITALDQGALVHEVLERVVVEALAAAGDAGLGWEHRWDHGQVHAIAQACCDRYEAEGRTGKALFWRRDRRRILADVARFVDADHERRDARRARPLAAELAFAVRDAALGPVAVPLPDGRAVRFRGLADRVDRGEDGTLYVVDYKTGSTRGFTTLDAASPDANGTKLQLLVYGEAARLHQGDPAAPVRAEYWFVSRKGGFKAFGYHVTDEVAERVRATLATIVAGIEQGVFPAHPTVVSSSPFVECPYCDPDGLGVAELRRQWEAKRFDPAVVPYTLLAEPAAFEGLDDDAPAAAPGAPAVPTAAEVITHG